MAAEEGPRKLQGLDDARACRPDLSWSMGSPEASLFEEMSMRSDDGCVGRDAFLDALSASSVSRNKKPQRSRRRPPARHDGGKDDYDDDDDGGGGLDGLDATMRSMTFERSDPRLRRLVSRMGSELPHALRELERCGRKSGHWAWWVWPTEKEGFSEPRPATAVTRAGLPELLRDAPPVWRQVLEKLCDLLDANGGSLDGVVPPIDWGRIEHFVPLFEQEPSCPAWLSGRVLPCFRNALARASGTRKKKTTTTTTTKAGASNSQRGMLSQLLGGMPKSGLSRSRHAANERLEK